MISIILTLFIIGISIGVSFKSFQSTTGQFLLSNYQKQAFSFINLQKKLTQLDAITRACEIQNNSLCCESLIDRICLKNPLNFKLYLNHPLTFKKTKRGQTGTLFIQHKNIIKRISIDAITGYIKTRE